MLGKHLPLNADIDSVGHQSHDTCQGKGKKTHEATDQDLKVFGEDAPCRWHVWWTEGMVVN
jgi:hypothetical protein